MYFVKFNVPCIMYRALKMELDWKSMHTSDSDILIKLIISKICLSSADPENIELGAQQHELSD